jgi:hypothetical protein
VVEIISKDERTSREMKVQISDSVEDTPFRLVSIEEVPAPSGQEGVWQRYVIAQGSNTIVGMRAGSRSEVDQALTDYVERLNVRFAKQQSKAKR